MPDPLRHVKPGDPLSIEARDWNHIVDATREVRAARTGGASPRAGANSARPDDSRRSALFVRVKNTTGATLPTLSVLTPSGVTLDPEDDSLATGRNPELIVSAPVTDADPVLILFAATGDGEIGPAVSSGVTVASVIVTDTNHRYARPIPGNITSLTSAATGQVRLLQTFGETGTYLCYVLLQGAAATEASTSTCTSPAWLRALLPSDCVRLSFTYTPPPAVELSVLGCDECEGGASEEYTFTLEGGTEDFEGANGEWTVTYDEDCTWTATRGDWTAVLTVVDDAELIGDLTLTGPGGAYLNYIVQTGVSGASWVCSGPNPSGENDWGGDGDIPDAPTVSAVEVDQEPITQQLDLEWDSADEVWRSQTGQFLTICGTDWTVELDQAEQTLTLVGPQPSGGGQRARFTADVSCGGCEYAIFDFVRHQLCCGAVPERACDRLLRVRVEQVACFEQGAVFSCGCTVNGLPRAIVVESLLSAFFDGVQHHEGLVTGYYDPDTSPLVLVYDDEEEAWLGSVRATQLPASDPQYPGSAQFRRMLHYRFFCDSGNWTLDLTFDSPPDGSILTTFMRYTRDRASGDCPDTAAEFDITLNCTQAGGIPGGTPGLETCDNPEGDYYRIRAYDPDGADSPTPPPPDGYTEPGWYLTDQGVLELDDDSPELCSPLDIICGPYETEELLDTAIAEGDCFDDDCPSIANWGGEGWYCTEVEGGAGSGGPSCEPELLTEDDRCDTTITICGGPYVDEAAAIAACELVEPPHSRYSCVEGDCVADEGGPFATLAECAAVCEEPDEENECCEDGFASIVNAYRSRRSTGCAVVTDFTDLFWAGGTLWSDFAGTTISCDGEGAWSFTMDIGGLQTVSGELVLAGCALSGQAELPEGHPCAGQIVSIVVAHPCPPSGCGGSEL